MASTNTHPCDVNGGRCDRWAVVDLGGQRIIPGIPGKIRYLCEEHAAKYTPRALPR